SVTPPAPTATYTLSLHDALPICVGEQHPVLAPRLGIRDLAQGPDFLHRRDRESGPGLLVDQVGRRPLVVQHARLAGVEHPVSELDRKSTRLNSSHSQISYAVFCL